MDQAKMYVLPEFGPIIGVLDALLSELHVGLTIYHLEDPDDATSLKLVYVNREAGRSTGIDMDARIGKRILDAFPTLHGTDLPQSFRDVVTTQTAKRIEMPHEEEGVRMDYSLRVFPMPANCLGVLFERQGESEETIGQA